MKILNRNEVEEKHTWNLKDIYVSESALKEDAMKVREDILTFNKTYKGKLDNADTVIAALDENAKLRANIMHIFVYLNLNSDQDQSDPNAMALAGEVSMNLSEVMPLLNFIDQEILRLDPNILEEVKDKRADFTKTIEDVERQLPHLLDPLVEDALSHLSATLGAPYEIYNMAKLVDMKFENVETEDQSIEMNFGYFEDELAFNNDFNIRHQAFDKFHKSLKEHENTFASVYKAQVLKEKSMARLKDFDNTIDYLLFDQEIPAHIYNNQIDTIMNELAPHMRKFAKHLQEIHGLETMTTNDLHLLVDPDFEPNISIEDSKQELIDGLSILGDEYKELIERAFDERWIDFPQNKGKSTGAYCSTPYGIHPYVLISWTEKMREVFVLAHELGHAGHFYLSGQHQSIYNARPSLFLIEAPSTMNEMLVANHMKKQSDDPRFKRWILSTLISRTYYHNFVTHLLEAAYQREVYHRIDNNQAISAPVLNELFHKVLKDFWGDDVEISEGSERTWMRQPHYYMGLYPYTYSAGLSIATESSKKILEGTLDIEQWKDFLKAGGSKNPVELAKIVDIDLNSDTALKNTIQFIGDTIDEIIALSKEIND